MYSATKFAVLGFSNALRLELKPFGIHVTTVNPGPIETAFFDQADPSGNYLASLGTFVLEPTKLAKTIVKAMIHPKREINRPQVMGVAAKFYTLFPAIGDYLAGSLFNKNRSCFDEKSMASNRRYFVGFSDRPFAVANNMTVPINFGFTSIKAPLILIIIGAALLGH